MTDQYKSLMNLLIVLEEQLFELSYEDEQYVKTSLQLDELEEQLSKLED